jgi:hypothetical protein
LSDDCAQDELLPLGGLLERVEIAAEQMTTDLPRGALHRWHEGLFEQHGVISVPSASCSAAARCQVWVELDGAFTDTVSGGSEGPN